MHELCRLHETGQRPGPPWPVARCSLGSDQPPHQAQHGDHSECHEQQQHPAQHARRVGLARTDSQPRPVVEVQVQITNGHERNGSDAAVTAVVTFS